MYSGRRLQALQTKSLPKFEGRIETKQAIAKKRGTIYAVISPETSVI
jgi:hypothetical protein